MKNKFCLFLTISILACAAHAQHENCNHGSAPESRGGAGISNRVQIPPDMLKNINLRVESVNGGKLNLELDAIGRAEIPVSARSELSSRIAGKVTKIFVRQFESVKAGEPVFEIESRAIGNPPPRIILKAPRVGIVESIDTAVGGAVEPSEKLAGIADISKLYAVANVFENDIGKLKIGQLADIRFEAYPDEVFKGTLVKFAPAINTNNSTLPAYFEIANPDGKIKAGMRARFSIILGQKSGALVVKNTALFGEGSEKSVFVQECPEDMIFEKRNVVVGEADDSHSSILHGLKAGEKIAVAGVYQLQFMPQAKEHEHSLEGVNSKQAHVHTENCAHNAMHANDAPHVHTANCAHDKVSVIEKKHEHGQDGHSESEHVHAGEGRACESAEGHSEGSGERAYEYWHLFFMSVFGVSVLLNIIFAAQELSGLKKKEKK